MTFWWIDNSSMILRSKKIKKYAGRVNAEHHNTLYLLIIVNRTSQNFRKIYNHLEPLCQNTNPLCAPLPKLIKAYLLIKTMYDIFSWKLLGVIILIMEVLSTTLGIPRICVYILCIRMCVCVYVCVHKLLYGNNNVYAKIRIIFVDNCLR